jgi:hypothetical protein
VEVVFVGVGVLIYRKYLAVLKVSWPVLGCIVREIVLRRPSWPVLGCIVREIVLRRPSTRIFYCGSNTTFSYKCIDTIIIRYTIMEILDVIFYV